MGRKEKERNSCGSKKEGKKRTSGEEQTHVDADEEQRHRSKRRLDEEFGVIRTGFCDTAKADAYTNLHVDNYTALI
ncbi:hypothetical protein V6N13_070468 [Hibiscus sabdariffa]|uniref:Uncharacterized protein n=1 Tax=Hibiscus sabdariffa TaxID=183260 RepID=A0ABR2TGM2_9ROSI